MLRELPGAGRRARDLLELGLGSARGGRVGRLTGAVDVVVSSAWVGARKPHRRIYAHTLEQLGVAPQDALFVGDTWACDVDGPRAAGMHAIYLRRAHLGVDHTAPKSGRSPSDVHHARRIFARSAVAPS